MADDFLPRPASKRPHFGKPPIRHLPCIVSVSVGRDFRSLESHGHDHVPEEANVLYILRHRSVFDDIGFNTLDDFRLVNDLIEGIRYDHVVRVEAFHRSYVTAQNKIYLIHGQSLHFLLDSLLLFLALVSLRVAIRSGDNQQYRKYESILHSVNALMPLSE